MTRNRQFYERMSVYTDIHRLRESGRRSIQWIANYMGLNFRTVRKYLKMSLEEYERYAEGFGQKPRKLEEYKEFIADKLRMYPDTSAAQMHDWLKEAHPFTSEMAVIAHEKAFEYFHGIPKEIIYDQDAVFLWDENLGAIRESD